MKYKAEVAENLQDAANLFANYFASVHTSTPNTTTFHCNGNCHNYFQISNLEIENVIKSLDQNQVNSPNKIPTFFIKILSNSSPHHFHSSLNFLHQQCNTQINGIFFDKILSSTRVFGEELNNFKSSRIC